jgi:hypothetical protein
MADPYNPTTRQEDWARSITDAIKENFRKGRDYLGIDPIKAKIDPQWFYSTVIDKGIEEYREDRRSFLESLKNYLAASKRQEQTAGK